MNGREHHYAIETEWTGNRGTGTSGHAAFGRDHVIRMAGKPDLAGSSDPTFRGDPARHNPEDLLVASLSACHMLWYLALCAKAGIVVTAYVDSAGGTMVEEADGGGRFTGVTLRPRATLATGADLAVARKLHEDAHRLCFIARSVNFPVACEPHFATAG
jgi:organic hydroperoxide reductase OsmC/OhrA